MRYLKYEVYNNDKDPHTEDELYTSVWVVASPVPPVELPHAVISVLDVRYVCVLKDTSFVIFLKCVECGRIMQELIQN